MPSACFNRMTRDPLGRIAFLFSPVGAVLAVVLLGFSGCATAPAAPVKSSQPFTAEERTVLETDLRTRPMVSGETGEQLRWVDLIRAIRWADVVILGERHDDGTAHALQRLILKDVLQTWPRSTLSMEMFERDEQALVDDYLDGILDTETFVRLTFSANWGGEERWLEWYQPIVDTARDYGASIVAANAPRRYVRFARTDGYSALRALPRDRRRYFDLPARLPEEGMYRERFWGVMSHGHPSSEEDQEAADARIEAIFRSQMVWDATMARSILGANPSRRAKVVHLVGQFHSDFEGGLISELRRHRPGVRILNVSLQASDAEALREEDQGRADIVIYTGAIESPMMPAADADDHDADDDEEGHHEEDSHEENHYEDPHHHDEQP